MTVIPFCRTDGEQAEQLCDWIYQLNGCHPQGHVLLVASGDTHKEIITKVQMAAEVAFLSVTILEDKANTDVGAKTLRINRAMIGAADFVAKHFNWPFLWLEPDSFPTKKEWLEQLSDTYFSQPKKFMGPFLQYSDKDKNEHLCMGRVGVYSPDAAHILRPFTATSAPFNLFGEGVVIPLANKSQLFQEMNIQSADDLIRIRPESVIVHSDKKSIFVQKMRAEAAGEIPDPPAPDPRSNRSDPTWKVNKRPAKVPYYAARAQLEAK